MRTTEYLMARYAGSEDRIATCRFARGDEILSLRFRSTPYWHTLLEGRHLGIHRPDDSMCNWSPLPDPRQALSSGSPVRPCLWLRVPCMGSGVARANCSRESYSAAMLRKADCHRQSLLTRA